MRRNSLAVVISSALLFLPMSELRSFASNSVTSIRVNHGAVRPPAGPKAACRIEVDDAHLSISILRLHGKAAVKIDARSICNFPQSNVELTVNIYKTAWFGDQFVWGTSTDPKLKSSQGFQINNYGTFVRCKDSKATTYYGVAFSRALIDGQTEVTKTVQSVHQVRLNCGT